MFTAHVRCDVQYKRRLRISFSELMLDGTVKKAIGLFADMKNNEYKFINE